MRKQCRVRSLKLPAWVVVIFASALSVAAAAAEDTASFDQAVKLYSQKQYKQALSLFLKCAQQNRTNGSAYYYAASCYYQLGDKADAKQAFQIVTRYYPASKEAALASQFLTQLDAVKSNGNQAVGGKAAPAPTNIAAALVPGKSATAGVDPDKPVDCSGLLQVVRPTQDHPAVSTDLQNAIRTKLQSMPAHVGRLLNDAQIKVQLTTTMIDAHPELKNREGRGYDGYTYKSCPGMFTGTEIILCERTMNEGDETVRNSFPISEVMGTFEHECGHAIDWCLGEVSSKDDFKHLYLLDASNLQRTDPDTANELRYYLQKSDAGQQECCGELIGILLGKNDERTDKMRRAFPETLDFLKGKLHMQ
jgi:tetratricopeptide (TPR) repeat protein